MNQSGSGSDSSNLSVSISIPETSTHTIALDFDLNKTPPSSPQNAAVSTNVVVVQADHRCNSCDRTDISTDLCPECTNFFHVDCLIATENASELMCAKCSMECHRRKKIRRTVSDGDGGGGSGGGDGVFDMNASPPCDFDGDDVAGDNIIQDTCGNPFIGFTSNSPNTLANMQIARLNLDIATENANLVYLQALKDYISEKRGVLGDGWCVKFKYLESICKNSPIYCAPNGSRFDSMQKVAHHLGLLSGCNSCEKNENGSSVGFLQNGSLSMVSNGGKALEIDPMENCNCGSESFLNGFPVQFEDFCIMSIGKIDPRFPFHSTSQIWPIGYKSIWHDKITGSIFVCNVIKNGDYGPLFRVNRYPCTKQLIPNASTVIYKPKGGPSDEISSCLTRESQDMTLNNFVNSDVIGEFSVEGRSPSSAWEIMLETLLFACRQTFQDLKVLNFCCNHSLEKSHHFYGPYGVDSLDKFGYLNSQVNSIPRLILTVDQLEDSCNVLRRWLLLDRFGLDVEFVQELIEQLPEADACSEYKYLNARCQNSIAHTVGSGFFSVIRKYHSQPMVSDSLTEDRERLTPPGNAIASELPHGLIGNVLQVYEFCLRFHNVLGQEACLSRQNLEYELRNPNIGSIKSGDKVEDFTSCSTISRYTQKESEGDFSQSLLSNFHMSMLKVVVEDMLAKVVICDPCGALESKSRKGRKKNTEINVYGKKSKFGIFPVNEITWPELIRRYIMILLSMDDNFDDLDITSRKFDEMFRCLNGDGGLLCSYLTGMAAIEADAVILAEASKKVFSSVKTKIVDFIIDKKDLNIDNSAIETKRTDTKCPEWIKLLEPIRKQPTNVGAKIRNRVQRSLDKRPPEWATEMLLMSISKEVYKGNAAGPTKKIVVEVLEKVRNENPLTKKKSKESRIVKTVSDVVIKRCRMVLRSVTAQDENKTGFRLMAESLLKANVSYDVGNPATVSRPLDFRTIDLRLDAGFYGDSHESFIEDVREVLQNLQMTYGKLPKYLDLIEKISKKLEELYEQEVLTLVKKVVNYWNGSTSSSEETKNELNTMFAETISSTLFVAPWEVGICKVCGKDENDHILLLCDRCDSEYHTYCLNPPLERIPKASWYCPPCISFITSQTLAQEEDFDSRVLSQSHPPERKKIQREFTRNGLEELADLADTMESVDYWELGVKERVFLLQFLCDETLSSTVIRNHINADGSDSRRNFLGQDSARRLYWVLGRPERLFVSGPHSKGEVCVTSGNSSSKEFDSWTCYESDAEISTLVDWLRDTDARERDLKESIINWQKNQSNAEKGQVEMHFNRLKSSAYCTNAWGELEKKFDAGRNVDEGKIWRCDCLEIVGSSRHHCFLCHTTYFDHEVHQCDDSLKPENESNPKDIIGKQPSSSSWNTSAVLCGRASEIARCLKIILLDIEAALPMDAFRPSRRDPDRLRGWRAFLKSAPSIYEMVQATIILEDMIKTEHLKKEWWYWSSPSAAAKISTISSLSLRIYALDAAIYYEKPPSPPPPPPPLPVDLTEPVVVGDSKSKEETPKKSNLKNKLKACSSTMMSNDAEPSKTAKFKDKKDKPKKKKLEVSID